jgi:hypothetical protein
MEFHMTQKQQIRQLVEQLKLDPTKLEQIDLDIETGLELMDVILAEFPDPSPYAHVFDSVELLLRTKTQYFRTREVC